ncbi:endothelin-converting enzyme homolog, partial [Actinia tenebrosa]|uniref:Endothelin-converting enzyme homolog n=1 Tax=Actinia tenebrosa TaxID=6105 RepID=A0A6P8HKS0_ACTTE
MNDQKYSLNSDEEMNLNSHNGPYSPDAMIAPSSRNAGTVQASHSKRPRIFILIIVLLLVTCGVLILLYSLERGRRIKAENLNQEPHLKTLSNQICTTEHCIHTASATLKNLDKKVNPCDNFYMFSCGGWKQEHPIPDSMSSWDQVEEIKLQNIKTLRRLLESKETRDKYSQNPAVLKVYDFYDVCTNTTAIESTGMAPLNNTIAKYGSWNITNTGAQGSWDFVTTLSNIQRDLDIRPLFRINVYADEKNSNIHRIMIDQTSHAITRQSYLANTSYHFKVRDAYRELMIDIAILLGATSEAGPQLFEIFNFEKKLSEISLPKAERMDKSKLYTLMTIKKLTNHSDNQIDWLQILNKIFKDTSRSFKEDDEVVVLAVEYIKKLAKLLKDTPITVIRNYMMWQVIVELAPQLGSKTQSAFFRFNAVTDGSSGTIPPWKKCIKEMGVNTIGYPLGLVFIDEKFRKESLDVVSKLINDQREAFIANLQDLDWMDESTRQKAKEKAEAIRKNIGYPEYLRNPAELNKRYKELTVNKTSYFATLLNLRRFTVYKELSLIKEPVDKNRWIVPPQRVNAFYDRVTNKITFPAGFLQPPFFDKGFPRAVSYGGLGIVVAHEITHGFDSNGRLYDKSGDLFNWWTKESNDAFVRKSQCFVDQYSNITDYDMNLNGKQTLGENIADNGAIRQAYMAYKNWVSKNKEELRLPGMNYTNDQLFFISAAQVDCGTVLPQTAKKLIETATHSLSKW